jgi:hypothetical protein
MRLIILFSQPILEDDYYRYLWDGSVVVQGMNPYLYSPEQVVDNRENQIPQNLTDLADQSNHIIHRINHPHLRTIYPPISQAFFAIANFISPWNINSWRVVLLLVDLVNLTIIFRLLKYLQISPVFLIVYWWNPLLVKEIFNSGHMDITIFPFLLSSLYFCIRRKYILSILLLALATGTKLWPLILLPLIFANIYPDIKKILVSFLLFLAILGIIFFPMYSANFDSSSGLFSYSKSWENNDTIFMLIVWLWEFILSFFNYHPGHAQFISRITVLVILTLAIIFMLKKQTEKTGLGIFKGSLIILTTLFFISPTQFPWYFVWVIPFLAIRPNLPLLLLTALLPFYYLRFYFEQKGMLPVFNYGIVWLEFIPVWILLILQWLKHRKYELKGVRT